MFPGIISAIGSTMLKGLKTGGRALGQQMLEETIPGYDYLRRKRRQEQPLGQPEGPDDWVFSGTGPYGI